MDNTVDITKLHDDRLPTDFHEGDEHGFIYTPSGGAEGEETPDGKALWVGATLYVQYPEVTLKQFVDDEDSPWFNFELTEEEKGLFTSWREKQYPKVSWIDSGDDENAYADFIAHYQEGENTERLLYRLCVATAAYTEIRNDFEIFYHGFENFMAHVVELREQRAEEFWHENYVEDDESCHASDVSSSYEELARAPYVVVVQDDQDRSWITACRTDKDIAQCYAGCLLDDSNEWVSGVYYFATGDQYDVDVTTTVTVSVNNIEHTITTGG